MQLHWPTLAVRPVFVCCPASTGQVSSTSPIVELNVCRFVVVCIVFLGSPGS